MVKTVKNTVHKNSGKTTRKVLTTGIGSSQEREGVIFKKKEREKASVPLTCSCYGGLGGQPSLRRSLTGGEPINGIGARGT